MASIANSIAAPFNAEDYEAIYGLLDPQARSQIAPDTIRKQLAPLRPGIGRIDSMNFVRSQRIQSPGTLPMFQLEYSLKLSGGQYIGGDMNIRVIDHGDHVGIVWFFVGGTVPK